MTEAKTWTINYPPAYPPGSGTTTNKTISNGNIPISTTVKFPTVNGHLLDSNTSWHLETPKPYKPMRYNKKPTVESLRKRPIGMRDRDWLAKLYTKQDISKLPLTVFQKLLAKELITVELTPRGKKEGCIEAIRKI
jgi:hypothetical protein